MIYIERTITIKKNEATIDEPIYLYKGDKNIELQFTIQNNPFKYRNGTAIPKAQLIIKKPNDNPDPIIISEPAKLSNNRVTFIITDDMTDEEIEIGAYEFQIRLINEDLTSCGTLPKVVDGIILDRPLGEPAAANSTYVNSRRSVVVSDSNDDEVFDEDGNYNMTVWSNGNIITDTKLNKVENAIYTINNNVTTDYSTTRYVDTSLANLEHQVELTVENESAQIKEYMSENYSTKDDVSSAIDNSNMINRQYVDDMIGTIEGADLTGYATESFVNESIANIDIPEVDLTGYATEDYVNEVLGDIEDLLGGI